MITYIVKARLARKIGTDDFSFETFEKEFRDEARPIKARKQAFQYYFSLIDIIGDEKDDHGSIQKNIDLGKKHLSENQDLKDKENKIHSDLGGHLVEGGELGVAVYYKLEEMKNVTDNLEVPYNEELMIAGYKSYVDYTGVIFHLEYENEVYDLTNWDTDN